MRTSKTHRARARRNARSINQHGTPRRPDYRVVTRCPVAQLRWLNRSASSGVADAALDLDAYHRSMLLTEGTDARPFYNDPGAMQQLFGVLLSLRAEAHGRDHDYGHDHSLDHDERNHQELERALSMIMGWTGPGSEGEVGSEETGRGEAESAVWHGSTAAELRREGVVVICDQLMAQLAWENQTDVAGRAEPGAEVAERGIGVDPLIIETLGGLFLNPPTSTLLNQTCPVAQVSLGLSSLLACARVCWC